MCVGLLAMVSETVIAELVISQADSSWRTPITNQEIGHPALLKPAKRHCPWAAR